MIPLIIGWALTYVGLYTVMIQKKIHLSEQTTTMVNSYKKDLYDSLFLAKASVLANAMQTFVNDNQIQTNLVQDLSNGVLNQMPSNTPIERFGVYLNQWATYNNLNYTDPIFSWIPFGEPMLETTPHYGQVRTYQQNFTYASMIPSQQQTLYWGSAADVFANAVSYNNRQFYFNMYQGYSSGMGYFSSGNWQVDLFHAPIPLPVYENCVVTGNPKVIGYDPRCRPWYLNQALPQLQDFGQYTDPYKDQTGEFTYVTVTEYGQLTGNSANFVAAIDLNLDQPFFSRTMTAYMTQDLKYFMSIARSNVIILKSNNETYKEKKTTAYFMIDEVLPDSDQNNQTTADLRGNFSLMYPNLDSLQEVFINSYQDWNATSSSVVDMDLITAPMFLVTQDPLSGGTGSLNQTFYMGVGLGQTHIYVSVIDKRGYILIGIQIAVLICCIILSWVFINLILHRTILPIEILKQRMVDLTLTDSGEFHVSDEKGQSEEIKLLYTSFSALLSNRRILNNEFLNKPDALAVIEIAEACTLFDGKSYIAAAVCYNNIGNLQYKNQKYNLAADNFLSAIILAEICLGSSLGDNVVSPEDFYDLDIKCKEVPKIENKEQEQYFKTARACRYYQFAMSLYKGLRYKGQNHFSSHQSQNNSILDNEDARQQHISGLKDTIKKFSQLSSESSKWQEVDLQLRNAVEAFQQITPFINTRGKQIPIFLDLIIKVTICRAYTMHKNRSIITAEKLLRLAESMIIVYEQEDSVLDLSLRNGAPVIPKDILKQKLCLHKGNLMISFGKMSLAKDLFLESINTGRNYDIRVRVEAIKNVLSINEGKRDPQYQKLLSLLNSYNHQDRDFVFLVNNSSHPSRSMVPHMARISDALNKLMDNKTGQIEDSDRIALITFAKNSNRVFSLVEKNQNFQQLKNQFQEDKLLANQGVKSQLGKAINNSTAEFDRKSSRKRWLVVFTNQVQKEDTSRVSLREASELLRRKQVNLVLIGFGLPADEVRLAEELANEIRQPFQLGSGCEMHLLLNPNAEKIDKLFTFMSNYKIIYAQPLIIETFKST